MHCNSMHMFGYCFLVFTVSAPFPSGRPRHSHRRCCSVLLLRRRPVPCYRASRQAEPFPSPTYRLPFPYYSCIRHCCCCTLIPILLHNLPLSRFTIVPCLILCCLVELLHQLALRPCPSAMLSYRDAITLGSDVGYLHYYNFNDCWTS